MTGLLILLIAAQAAPVVPAPPVMSTVAPVPPTDWSIMPPLPWRMPPQLSPDLQSFAADEVRAGRCTTPRPSVDVEMAVMVRADGFVRAVVPRAIDCPTVEQFAAGLVTSFARNNLRQPAAGWYRATITFDWGR
ncbi:MAG: hypothetical protein V4537_16290 [Pseudomonadota bacterium]